MQSALNANTESLALVDAKAMKEMTVTPESIYTRQRTNVLESLMEAMVKAATERGDTTFHATLQSNFDPALLADITGELSKLGYALSVKDNAEKGSVLTVSWA